MELHNLHSPIICFMLHKELYELLQIIKRGGGLKTMCPYNSGSKRGREAHQKMYCWFFEKSCLKQMGHFGLKMICCILVSLDPLFKVCTMKGVKRFIEIILLDLKMMCYFKSGFTLRNFDNCLLLDSQWIF